MRKYVVIYHTPASAMEAMKNATPEDMKEGMEAWAQRCGDGLVDLGTPLGGGLEVTESGNSPSDTGVAGYSVLQADDMEGAPALLQEHPHLGWAAGCEIEIHESLPLPEWDCSSLDGRSGDFRRIKPECFDSLLSPGSHLGMKLRRQFHIHRLNGVVDMRGPAGADQY